MKDWGAAVNLRDNTQQVLDGEVWNNHLVLLDSRHAIPRTHSDCDCRDISQYSFEAKKKSRNGRG